MKVVKACLYWLLNAVWGLPTFLFGLVIAIGMLVTGHKPKRFGYTFYFVVNSENGWGLECGPIFLLTKDCENNLQMKQHEHGHGIQVMWWGPLFMFVIAIPSAIRFHYRNHKLSKWAKQYSKGKITKEEYISLKKEMPAYSAIWFEKQADEIGKKFVEAGN